MSLSAASFLNEYPTDYFYYYLLRKNNYANLAKASQCIQDWLTKDQKQHADQICKKLAILYESKEHDGIEIILLHRHKDECWTNILSAEQLKRVQWE
jgi:hypothetical protein